MFGWIERRRAVRRDAEAMLQEMPGRSAWHAARDRGRDMSLDEDERALWWRVAAAIEDRVGIDRDPGSGFAPPI